MQQKFLLGILCFLLFSCTRKAEFYRNGKGYYTDIVCLRTETKSEYGYEYGFNPLTLTYEYYAGFHDVDYCVEYRIDTIEIKTK